MTELARPDLPMATLKVFLVAAEESGDRLGADLMRALRQRAGGPVSFAGVGGRAMAAEGVTSLYSINDIPIIGFTAIPRRLPNSPAFTCPIARRVRARDPTIPIVEYVSPSVWAWRPGRGRAMRSYIDHILALLPFEPAVHERLGGPPCTYVGHSLAERAVDLRPNAAEARRRQAAPPVLLVLPGSRTGELRRLLDIFADTVARVGHRIGALEVIVPTVAHLLDPIRAATERWPVRPRIVVETADKQAAFRIATAALAKSGTVTLELALAGVPMVAAYKISPLEYLVFGRAIAQRLSSVILANLVLGENVVPEFLQRDCTSARLADALLPLLVDGPERRRQVEAFARLDAIMEIGSRVPAARAADIVLGVATGRIAR